MKRIIFYILTVLLSMTTLTACGMLPHETTVSPKTNVPAPTESLAPSTLNKDRAQQQARQLLAKKDYVATISLIQDEISRGKGEHTLAEEYLQAANHSLVQAETLMNQEHYPQAALLLKIVQESYPKSFELQQQVTASPTQLTIRINLCTEKLMEEGLVAYRSGSFTTAINAWEQVLAFNPEHQGAQSSIQTTQLQLSNLRSMDGKN